MLMFFNKIRKSKKGYTLTELIVVVAILGVLAAAATPSVMGYISDAKASADATSVAVIQSAVNIAIMKDDTLIDASGNIKDATAISTAAKARLQGNTIPTCAVAGDHFYVDKRKTNNYIVTTKASGDATYDLALN